jgi:hypothetical protein
MSRRQFTGDYSLYHPNDSTASFLGKQKRAIAPRRSFVLTGGGFG